MDTPLSDLLAVGREYAHGGKTYTVRRPSLLEQAQFSQWLKDRAKLEAFRTPDATAEERDALVRAANRDCAEGYYEVDSPGYLAAQSYPSSFVKLLHIIFRRDNPQLTEDDVRAMLEGGLREAFVQVLAAEETADPKVLAAVLQVLGFPPDYLTATASTSGSSSSEPAHPPSEVPPTSPPS